MSEQLKVAQWLANLLITERREFKLLSPPRPTTDEIKIGIFQKILSAKGTTRGVPIFHFGCR